MASNIFHMFSRCSVNRWKASRFVIGIVKNEKRSIRCSSTGVSGTLVTPAEKLVVRPPTSDLAIEMKGQEEDRKDNSHDDEEEELKNKILDASLPFVNSHGWSTSAITAGAESLGYPGVVHGMFPRGGFDLINHFYLKSNNKLVEILKEDIEAMEKDPNLKRSEREIVERAVERRLKMIIPYFDKWTQALAIMTLPHNALTSLASLLTLVDDICYYAGDRSVDMSWYGKRVGLAGVYRLTELYMLQDGSEDKNRTWQFLHRRMDELFQLHNIVGNSDSTIQFTKDFGSAVFSAARNILGMGWNR